VSNKYTRASTDEESTIDDVLPVKKTAGFTGTADEGA
jgi:hypothetical protein